jgi:AcrR family transcriptional regulator
LAVKRTTKRAVSRPTELTRKSLIEAATDVFAEHGYEGGTVRAITREAKANAAAITYHFGGKEGLYREVLVLIGKALDQQSLITLDKVDEIDRDEAVRLYMRQYLLPLAKRDQVSRYLRILAWESVRPSAVFLRFIEGRAFPVILLAERIVRRYLAKDATPEKVAAATLWIANQPFAFVRDADFLRRPPWSLKLDQAFVDRLVDLLARLSVNGLKAGA